MSQPTTASSHLVEDVPTAPHAGGTPTEKKPAGGTLPGWASVLLSRYALLLVWAVMAAYFWVRVPDLFGTHATFSAIFGSQQVLVFLAMSVLVTSVAGEIDLSVASVMGVSATTIPVLADKLIAFLHYKLLGWFRNGGPKYIVSELHPPNGHEGVDPADKSDAAVRAMQSMGMLPP